MHQRHPNRTPLFTQDDWEEDQKGERWDISVVARNREMDRTPKTENVILDINILLKPMPFMPSSSSCIDRVPCRFRGLGKEMYEPHVISIGPYHRGKEILQACEEYKVSYLHSFMGRNPKTVWSDYVKAIRELEVDARKCYAEEINLNSDEFVMMMVLDGCFILELFMKYQVEESNMESKDRLFSATWIVPSLRRDMVLLENQIPFIVLDQLYNLSQCSKKTIPLIELALDFFDPILPTILTNKNHPVQAKHLLDLLRNHLIHQFKPVDFGNHPFWEYTTCATSLHKAGVKLQRTKNGECLLDIKFTKNGKLEMPPFTFGESWKVLYPNLIALEQSRRDYPDMITSYVIFVNRLINSHEDVQLLCNAGIIDCLFIKENKVVEIVDKLCQEVVVDKFYYDGICNQVNAYRRKPWNKWRATLMHNHVAT